MRSVSSKVLMPSRLHFEQHLLNRSHTQLKTASQIVAIERKLTLDIRQPAQVVGEQRYALVGDRVVAAGQRVGDAERVRKLQSKPVFIVERLADVALQRLEAARDPGGGLPVFRPPREPCAHREYLRCHAEQPRRRVPHERPHFVELVRMFEDIHLIDDQQDLLPPVADRFEECSFRFGERSIG